MIRHGETDYNRLGLIQGGVNIPLNELGLAQAEEAALYFKENQIVFDRVYTSPLIRAWKTASVVSGWDMDQIIPDERISEMKFGVVEGVDLPTAGQGFVNLFENPPAYVVPEGGETIGQLQERTSAFLDELRETVEKDGLQTVMVASHGAAVRGLLSDIDHVELKDFWRWGITNCCIIHVTLENGVYEIRETINPLKNLPFLNYKKD